MSSSSSPITFISHIQETVVEEAKATKFDVVTFPNPSTSQFNVKVQSDNSKDKIELRVMNAGGRAIRIIQNLAAGQSVQFGSDFRPGIYYLEMVQGTAKKSNEAGKTISFIYPKIIRPSIGCG